MNMPSSFEGRQEATTSSRMNAFGRDDGT